MKTVFHDFQGSLRDSDIHSSLPSRDTSSYSPTVWSQPVLLVPRFTPIQPCRQVTVVTRHNTNVMLGLEWGTTTLFTMEQLREGGRERCMLDMDPWKNLITPPRYDAPAPRLRTGGGGVCCIVPIHVLHSKSNVIPWCCILGSKIKCYYACSLLLLLLALFVCKFL